MSLSPDAFFNSVTPFISLTIAEAVNVPSAKQLDRCVQDFKAICAPETDDSISNFKSLPEQRPSGARVRAMWYRRTLSPAWTQHKLIVDLQHHIVLVVARKNYLAIHLTDPKLRGQLKIALMREFEVGTPLSWLFPISRSAMSAAFLEDGKAKTLWLSGIHRRSATRPDAKILAGQDLDLSLDPFDDQSFYWSSARSKSAVLDMTIGVSPRTSRIWVGKAQSLKDFTSSATQLIDAVASARISTSEPFRFLARPVQAIQPSMVKDGYDLSILPPYMLQNANEDGEEDDSDAALISRVNLIAESATGADLAVTIEINGQAIGTLTLKVTVQADGTAKFSADNVVGADGIDGADRIAALLVKGTGVNIRYDSGHSISDNRVYILGTRRIDFREYEAREFSGYAIKKEKPDDLSKIGDSNTLFCWVQHNYKGWLACDDGANEKADFIHVDTDGARPVLSLIHVKAAKSDMLGRKISVSAYEVVTSQAVKNLQWLDKQTLATGLAKAARASNHWWKGGKPTNKSNFVSAIDGLGDDYVRRVVIVQPHITRKAHTQAAATKTGVNRLRLDQLNTLLASAWRSSNGLGAEFKVIWAK